jgi:formate hydrogenlyase transcriptional activator
MPHGTENTDRSAKLPTHSQQDRELIDTTPAILWRANAQTFQFTFVSPYAETLFGWPLQRWTEPSFWKEHTYPEDRDWVVARRTQATKGGGDYDVEYRLVTKDGRALWVRELGRVLARDNNGSELAGVIVDHSQKRSAKHALEEGKHWLRQVIDTIPVEIWSGPADGTLDFCNARWRSELGLTLEELGGDGWQKTLHPDDRDRVLKAWDKSVTNGTPYEQEERHRLATGEYRWFLCRGVPLRDEHGKILRWFGTNTDIDNQKRADEALRESEQRWRGVFDNTKVGIALMDSSLHYLKVNAAYETMFGYGIDELRPVTCLDLTFEEERPAYKALVDDLVAGRRDHFELEKRYRRKNGQRLWTRVSGSVLTRLDGASRQWVMIVEDITERKRLHDQLQRERDRLRLLLDLNNTFASKLSLHDFFHALAESLREIEGWEYSFVALPESPGDLKVHLVGASTGELRVGTTIPIKGTIAGDVYRSGQPQFFRIADLDAVPNHPELTSWREFARAEGLQAGCNLPLRHDGKVLGVLGFHTRNDIESAREDLGFLQELAKLVAIALNNALRYGELNESHEKLINEKGYIEDQLRADFSFGTIIGESAGLRGVLQQVDAVAPTDSTVLILGETGTGKELIARAIHDRGPRRGKSFIKVDCSAIPGSLMESELFGHEKGAFTGAISQKLGRFEAADGGTLFLDEIGDVPLALQTKLLRVLQDGAIERLGSNRTRKLNVRIITATNRDLESMVEKGGFREDLYYRLKVFPIEIPPLRARPEDIPPLVRYYVAKYAQRMRKQIDTIPARAMDLFTRYPWPGNVRELQHFIERSVILSHGKVLQAPLAGFEQAIRKGSLAVSRPRTRRTMEEIERESIREALRESNWMVGGPNGAAAKLGMKRTTLASRMEKLGISRERQ